MYHCTYKYLPNKIFFISQCVKTFLRVYIGYSIAMLNGNCDSLAKK